MRKKGFSATTFMSWLKAGGVIRNYTVLVAIIALSLGCSRQQGIKAEAQKLLVLQAHHPKCEQQWNLDMFEAVFRYQFKHNASAAQQTAKAYFLTILNRDPPDMFLARFNGSSPPVRKGSEFSIGMGLAFSIKSICRIDKNSVRVSAGYFEAGLSSSDNIYTVVSNNGEWVVVNDEMLWISQGGGQDKPYAFSVFSPPMELLLCYGFVPSEDVSMDSKPKLRFTSLRDKYGSPSNPIPGKKS